MISEESIMRLYDSHAPALLALCMRYCGDMDIAKDLLQDSFVMAFRKRALFTYRREGSEYSWLRRITVNTCLMYLRKKDSLKGHEDISACPDVVDEVEDNLLVSLLDRITMEDLLSMIQRLAPKEKAVFNLYMFEGWSHRDIALHLGIKEKTSSSMLVKAKRKLIEEILEYVK